MHQSVNAYDGYVFQIIGDAFCVAFHSASDALSAALFAQKLLYNEVWSPAPIKVRMGIHTGTAQLKDDKQYSGYATLALTQRIVSAGHGGQVLLSGATRELVRDSLPMDSSLQDLGEKQLKDLLRPEHLYQLNISGLPTAFPPVKTLDLYLNNLPVQLTTFIGRENEIAEVKDELESHRLVTLTGSGGTGKTRLSLQVAAEMLDHFEHGVWFVEFAPLADPDLIPQTILSAIGINEQQGKTPLDVLKEYLRDKKTLIVLDNCEHIIEASARVANAVLRAAPEVKILVSSREALGVKGELSYPVPSLSLPDIKHLPVIEQLSQYEAVRLFIDRASLVSPHFNVDKKNAPAIAQICYRLDGIPLAIELAAARVKVMSVEQISRRLDDRFHLLTGGARTALPRQQTLRALIDWSYDLLSENERLLLRRLAVFSGSWTLEAAEEVCAGQDDILAYDVLDLLTQLVNKSLVLVVEHSQSGESRYRLLETIRQYAREKLFESGSGEKIHDRHFDYYQQVIKQAEPEMIGPRETIWLDWFETELDNLRAALDWAIEKRPTEGLRLFTRRFGFFLWDHFYYRDMENWLSQLLQKPVNLIRTGPRAEALVWLAWCALGHQDINLMRSLIDECLSISEEIKDRDCLAFSLLTKGILYLFTDNYEEGYPLVQEALEIFRAVGDRVSTARSLSLLSDFSDSYEYETRIFYLEEQLQLNREIDSISGIVDTLVDLCRFDIFWRKFDSAHKRLDEAVSILQDRGMMESGFRDLKQIMGLLAEHEGNYELAQTCYEEDFKWSEQKGYLFTSSWTIVRLGYVSLRRGNLQEAHKYFHNALALFQRVKNAQGMIFTLEGLASLAVNERQWEKAILLFSWATKQREVVHDRRVPVEQDDVDRHLVVVRDHINDDAYQSAWVHGEAMTLEEAIVLASKE